MMNLRRAAVFVLVLAFAAMAQDYSPARRCLTVTPREKARAWPSASR